MKTDKFIQDPRWLQIFTLSSLLVWQWLGHDFRANHFQAISGLIAAVVVQILAVRLVSQRWQFGFPAWGSALISALSLALLLRGNPIWLHMLAAVLAVGSKFTLRWGYDAAGRHIFNPANIAIVLLLLLMPQDVWVSPGQWGRGFLLLLIIGGTATFVLSKARTSDAALAFLGAWGALLLGRHLWFGDPLEIALHHLSNAVLFLYAFFMISDPKTAPDSRLGRIIFAAGIAVLAFTLQFGYQIRAALFFALPLMNLTVPLINYLTRRLSAGSDHAPLLWPSQWNPSKT